MDAYVLTAPLTVGPRLMPSAAIGSGSETGGRISAEIIRVDSNGRARLMYFIDFPGGKYYGNDISISPLYANREPGAVIREGIATLCGFLSAEAERYQNTMGASEPPEGWAFSATVAEWAYLNSDDLGMVELELSEDAEG